MTAEGTVGAPTCFFFDLVVVEVNYDPEAVGGENVLLQCSLLFVGRESVKEVQIKEICSGNLDYLRDFLTYDQFEK
jgi:hypothetical protein